MKCTLPLTITALITLSTSCGPQNGPSKVLAQGTNSEVSSLGEQQDSTSHLPLIGSSTTKTLIRNGRGISKSILKNSSSRDAKSGIEKIRLERAALDADEAKQKYFLRGTSYVTDAIFTAMDLKSKGASTIITKPLRFLLDDFLENRIRAKVLDHDIQMGKTISLLAQIQGPELAKKMATFQNGSIHPDDMRKSIIKAAQENLTQKDADHLRSLLNDAYLTTAIKYAMDDLAQIKASTANLKELMFEANQRLAITSKNVQEIEVHILQFIEGNRKFIEMQKDLITGLSIDGEVTLARVDFLAQMTFGNLNPSDQLYYLENSSHLIPLSSESKNKLKESLRFKVGAQNALNAIVSFEQIGSNLELLGSDGHRTTDVATTLLTSALGFASGNPFGYLQGAASLTSLFARKRSGSDPRLDMILRNQEKIMSALQTIQQDLFSLRSDLNKGMGKLNEEIYFSRTLALNNYHSDKLAHCQLLAQDFDDQMTLESFRSKYSNPLDMELVDHCLRNLTLILKRRDYRESDAFISNISYRANTTYKESELVASYEHAHAALLSQGYSEDAPIGISQVLDPNALSLYVSALLNNLHFFDLTTRTTAGRVFVANNKLGQAISNNRTSVELLNNALYLLKGSLYQHRLWAGIIGSKEFFEMYESQDQDSSQISCEDSPENVLCIASRNAFFFSNLVNQVIHRKLGTKYYFAAMKVAPTDPGHITQKINGPVQLVWIGHGSHPLYNGEIYNSPELVRTYGNGAFFRIKTKDRLAFIPAPSWAAIKGKLALDMPRADILVHLIRLVEDELLEIKMPQILTPQEQETLNTGN